ncbi:hypothetical protein OE88DRAFT_1264656 [Heliocybe sulcata]|uniref:F-box domain-containing protein n=1 Tax=Heliocybe sulcata TaxID=5364 RepID=A0A5C3N735_9AGAM|nr:hypothetical protein OE88DRAFT_1264656 [Heliocybe sulcata]
MVNPLPLDVWYRILSSFSPAEICRLRQVNRAFYDLTRERQVWVDAYLNTRLPTSDGPISSKSAKELEMELRRTAMLDACYGGSMSPVLRHQINGLPGFDPTRHLFDPPGFHRERYGWMNLVRGRWLVACHARANRITCYDLEASDPSEAPISWGAITGDRIYAATCYACAEEDALLYAYVDGEDAITVLKLQLSPYPITFQRIHRLEWNFHELPDVRQDAFKLFQLVLNESWLFACCLGRNNYIGTLFHLHSQGIYSVPYPEISSAGDVHDLQWYMPFLTSTHLWLFTGSASSRALFPLSTPGRFELFTLPKAESVVDPASPLTLSHSRRFDNWYMIFGAYALSTHSQLSTLSRKLLRRLLN